VANETRLYQSRFLPDPARGGEFLASLWQGPVPATLTLHKWLYVDGSPRAVLLLWEGDAAAAAYVERAFGGFGALTTEVLTDATEGLALAFARDLDGFGAWLADRGTPADDIPVQLDVRRRGREAASQDAAAAAGRAWTAEQAAR
jgi:hypothetical protein